MYTVLVIHIEEPYGREALISVIFIDGNPQITTVKEMHLLHSISFSAQSVQ